MEAPEVVLEPARRSRARRPASPESDSAGFQPPVVPSVAPEAPIRTRSEVDQEPVLAADPALAVPTRAFERSAERREMQIAALAESRRAELEETSENARKMLERAVAKLVEAVQESAEEARNSIRQSGDAERKGLARAVVERIDTVEEQLSGSIRDQTVALEQVLAMARATLAEEVAGARTALERDIATARSEFDSVGSARTQELSQRTQVHEKGLQAAAERERQQITDLADSAISVVEERTRQIDTDLAGRVDAILDERSSALGYLIEHLREAERSATERVADLEARSLAGEYATLCQRTRERLEQCAALIRAGNDHAG